MSSIPLFYVIASIPFLLAGLIAVVWAVQRLIDLPREGWLVIVGTAILMFGMFGVTNILNAALRFGLTPGSSFAWQFQIAVALITFAIRATGWAVLLAAVFGPQWLSPATITEDWGLPSNDEAT